MMLRLTQTMAVERPAYEPQSCIHRTSSTDKLVNEREEFLMDSIAADKCRVAAAGSRLSLACRVELINCGQNSAVFNQLTHVAREP